jgi:hypothetical protein
VQGGLDAKRAADLLAKRKLLTGGTRRHRAPSEYIPGEGNRQVYIVSGDTRIKAVNKKDRNFTRASLTQFIKLTDAKLDDYLQCLDQSDVTESKTISARVKNLTEKIAAIRARRTRCQGVLAQLEQTGEEQISLTNPDSRAMAAHARVGPSV